MVFNSSFPFLRPCQKMALKKKLGYVQLLQIKSLFFFKKFKDISCMLYPFARCQLMVTSCHFVVCFVPLSSNFLECHYQNVIWQKTLRCDFVQTMIKLRLTQVIMCCKFFGIWMIQPNYHKEPFFMAFLTFWKCVLYFECCYCFICSTVVLFRLPSSSHSALGGEKKQCTCVEQI